jgi:hypothetical protein
MAMAVTGFLPLGALAEIQVVSVDGDTVRSLYPEGSLVAEFLDLVQELGWELEVDHDAQGQRYATVTAPDGTVGTYTVWDDVLVVEHPDQTVDTGRVIGDVVIPADGESLRIDALELDAGTNGVETWSVKLHWTDQAEGLAAATATMASGEEGDGEHSLTMEQIPIDFAAPANKIHPSGPLSLTMKYRNLHPNGLLNPSI